MLVDAWGHGGPIADKWCVHFWNVFQPKKDKWRHYMQMCVTSQEV